MPASPTGEEHVPRPRIRRVLGVAAAVQGTNMLPMFLTGSLAVQLQRDLGFGPTTLGVATGTFVLARAVTSVPFGRLIDRLGATRSMKLATAGSALTLGCIAVLVHHWIALVLVLAFGGTVQAITQPAVNRFVARSVPDARLGLAFGVKQSGPPAGIILAGLAVPVLGVTLGWRWAFGVAALLTLAVYAAIPQRPTSASVPVAPGASAPGGKGLGLVMIGMAFALAAVNSMQTFLVDSGVDAGLRPGAAGTLLAAGGVVAIAARIGSGLRADSRGGGHLSFVARMLAGGALGYLLLSTGVPMLYVVGGLLAYGSLWGMNGVLFMAIVRHRPDAPAAASGSTIAVGSIGGFLGPPVFGFIVEHFSYAVAWWVTAGWAAIAAASIAASSAARHDPRPPRP